jgi:hypothetical protein
MIIHAPHAPNQRYLAQILKKMRRLGPPRLKAYWRKKDDAWYALEGSHRIAAAKKLGLVPILDRVYLSWEIGHDTNEVWPDKKVRSLLKFYDDHRWWVRYKF